MLKREAKMATVSGVCHNDPNFAVICSFLDRYSEMLALPSISYSELESWIEETKRVNPNLIDLHVRLLRRSGKKSCLNVTHDRWEKALFKFCHSYSNVDAWEIERFTYRHCKITTKLKLLKNLLECQFDTNIKFKDRVNEIPADDMRCLPIGRDKHGLAYWFMLDKSLNLRIYRNDLDDVDSETWQLVCRDRDELAKLIQNLEKGDFPKIEKSDLSDASCKSEPVSDFNEDSRDSFTRSRSCTPIKPSPLTIKSEHTDEEDNDSNSEPKHSSGRLTMTLKVPKLEAVSPRKRLKDKFEKEKGLQIKNKKKCKIKEEKGDEEEGSCDNENIVSTKTEEDADKHEISEKSENDINSNCDENVKEPDITEGETNTSAIKCDKSIDGPKSTEKDDKDLDENSGENIKNDEMSEKETDKTEDEVKNDEVDGLGNEVSDAEVVQVNKETPVDSSKEATPDLEKKTSDSDEIPSNENDLTLENAGIDKNNSSKDDQDKTSKSNVVSLEDSKQFSDAGSNVPDSAESELKEMTPLASDKDCKTVTEGSKDPNLPDEISCTDKELTQLETESNLSVEQEQKLDSDTANSIEKTIPCKVDQISDLSENLSKVDKIEEAPVVSTKDDIEKHELSENKEICLNEQKLNEQNDELSATKLDSDDKKDDRTEIRDSKKSDNDSDTEQQEPSSESICPNSLKESDIGSKKLVEDSEERIEKSNKEQEMDVKQSWDILHEKTLKEGDNSHTESIESHDKLSKGDVMDSLKEEKCSQDDLNNGKNLPEVCTDTTETVSKEDSMSDEKPQPKSEEASPSENLESVQETTVKKEDEQGSDKCAIKSNDDDGTDQENSSGRDSEISERNPSDTKSLEEEKDKELNEAAGDAVNDDKHKTDSEISERNSSDTKSLEEEKDKEINEETGLCLSSFTASPGTGDAVKDDKHKTESTELEEDSCKDGTDREHSSGRDSEISERNSSDTKSFEEEKDKEINEETGDAVKDDKHKTDSNELEQNSCKDNPLKEDNTHCSKDEEVKSVVDVLKDNEIKKNLDDENTELKDNEIKENLDDENTEEDEAKCEQISKVRKATKRQTKVAVRKLTKASKSKSVTSKKSGAVEKDKDEEHSDKESSSETSEEDTSSSESSEHLPKTKMKGLLAHSRLSRGKALKRQAEDSCEEEPVEPASKRSKVRGRVTSKGRNKRQVPVAESSDSSTDSDDVPLSQVSGKTTGKGKPAKKAQKKKAPPAKKKQSKPAAKKTSKPVKKRVSSDEEDTETTPVKSKRGKSDKSKDEENHEEDSKPPEDEDFDLSEEDCGRRRSARVRTLRARKKEPSPEYLPSDLDDLNLDFDSGDDDFVVRSKRRKKKLAVVEEEIPKGKNAKRLEAKTSKKTKQVEEEEEESEDETPCCKCLKSEQPEWILLCDKCDAGYHTACLRPPLMIIPDGDWYCPPCEHAMLIEKLQENLTSLDQSLMKSDRLVRRKERLAFVGISLDNIIKEEKAEEVEFQTDTESASSNSEESKSESESESESSESSAEQEEQRYPRRRRGNERVERRKKKKPRKEERQSYVKRTCRSRNPISYKFEEFDELIMDAIHEDMSIPKQPKPKRVVPPGISRGKDMSNILGVSDEEEKEKKKSLKKRRPRLTELDDTEEDDDTDDYHVSLESSATDVSRESEGVAESGSDFSDEVRGRRRGRRGARKATRKSHRKRRGYSKYDDFVVESDYDSEEDDYGRRSTRKSARRHVNYRELNSDESIKAEETDSYHASDFSSDEGKRKKVRGKHKSRKDRKKRHKRHKKRKHVVSSDEESEETDSDSRPSSKKKDRKKRYDSEAEEDTSGTSGDSDGDQHRRHMVGKPGKKKGRIESDETESETGNESKSQAKGKRTGKVLESETGSESEAGKEKGAGDGDEDGSGTEVSEGDWEEIEIDINSGSDKLKSPKHKGSPTKLRRSSDVNKDVAVQDEGSESEEEEEEELEPGEIRVKRTGKNIRKRKKSESNSQEELDHVTKSYERSEKETAKNSGTPIYECSVSLEPLSDTVLHSDSIYKGEHSMEELQDSASDSSPVKKKRTRRTKAQMEAARKVEEEMIQQLIVEGVPPEVARKRICGKKARSRSLEQLPAPVDTSDRAGSVTSVSEVTLPARSEEHVRVESSERQTNVGESDNKKIDTEIVIKKEPSERKDDSPLSARRDYNNAPVGIVKPEVRQGVIVENRQVMDSMRGPLGPGGRPLVGNMVSPLQGMKEMSMGKIPDQGGFSPPNMPPGYQNRGNSEGFRQPNYPGYPPQQGPYGHPQQGFQQGMPHRPYPHSDDQGPMSPSNYPPPAAGQYMSPNMPPNMPPGPQGFHPGSFRASLEGPQSPPAGYGGYGPGAPIGGPNYPQQGPYGQGFHSPTGPYQGQMHGPYPEPPGQQPGPSAQMNYPPNMPSGYPQIPQPRHPHPGGMHYPPSVPPVSPNQPVRPQPYSTPHTGAPQADPGPVKSTVAGVPARSRRGFMMDNILKPTSSRPKEDENGDEINDIVNYVANDEYFKEH